MYEHESVPPKTPTTFLYLRTKLTVGLASDAIYGLYLEWQAFAPPPPYEDRAHLLMPINGGTWADGIVFGLPTIVQPKHLGTTMKPALDQFGEWQIVNLNGEWAESANPGLLSRFFKQRREKRFAQIFVGYDAAVAPPDQAIDALCAVYGPDKCMPVMHFRDGKILLLSTSDPARVIHRKMRQACKGLDYLCGCDFAGEAFSSGDLQIWDYTSLRVLELE